MTVYESLMSKIDNLRRAGDNCMRNGKTGMALVWYSKAFALSDEANSMSVELAGSRA
jgi:hypothetical protein